MLLKLIRPEEVTTLYIKFSGKMIPSIFFSLLKSRYPLLPCGDLIPLAGVRKPPYNSRPLILCGNVTSSAVVNPLKSRSPPIFCGNVKPLAVVKLLKLRSPIILLGNVKPSAVVKLSK